MDPITLEALQAVLIYVEAWNKKDEDKSVAGAAAHLQTWLDAQKPELLTEKFAVTSAEAWEKYVDDGDSKHLNDVKVSELKSGDKIVISREGEEAEVEIK